MAQAGYVYIIHGVGTNFIKVGKTTNVMKRLRDLARGVPFPTRVISVELVFDMDKRENELLVRYADYRCRGEWFALPEDTLQQWPLGEGIAPWTSDQLGGRRAAAKGWLRDFLGAQEIASVDIAAAATAVGISGKGLRSAKESLHVEARKRGNRWYWVLPNNAPQRATENI